MKAVFICVKLTCGFVFHTKMCQYVKREFPFIQLSFFFLHLILVQSLQKAQTTIRVQSMIQSPPLHLKNSLGPGS